MKIRLIVEQRTIYQKEFEVESTDELQTLLKTRYGILPRHLGLDAGDIYVSEIYPKDIKIDVQNENGHWRPVELK